MKTFEEVLKIANVSEEFDCTWVARNGQIFCSFNMNDFFAWACADAENIEVEDIPEFMRAIDDCNKAKEDSEYDWGPELWAARKRGVQPQIPVFKNMPSELHDLFRAGLKPAPPS